MKLFLRCLLLILFLLQFNSVFSQKSKTFDPKKKLSQLHIDHWKQDRGLPVTSLLAMIHTSDGYIWIGSYDGLTRFDGKTFDHFTKSNTPAFNTNTITQLLETPDGTLWLGTQGSGLVSYRNGKFQKHGMEAVSIECLYAGKNKKHIYIGSRGDGLYRYDIKNKKTERLFTNTLGSHTINDIIELDGNLWIASKNGIYINNGKSLKKLKIAAQKITPKKLHIDKYNTLWVGTYQGIFVYKNGKFKRKIPQLNKDRIYDLIHDEHNSLWIATRHNIYRENVLTGALEELKTRHGESFDDVKSFCFDQEKSLWIPNQRHGLSRVKDGKFLNFSASEGLSSSSINSLTSYRDSLVLVGSSVGTIDIFDYKHNKSSKYPLKTNLDGWEIFNIREDKEGILWVSTYKGLLRVSPNHIEKLYTDKDGLPNIKIRMTFEDKKGRFWLGTRGAGLVQFHKKENRFQQIGKNKGFKADFVMCISEDNEGNLIVGTNNNGLFIEENGKFVQYNISNGLPTNLIFNVYCDDKNTIWIATNVGISHLENKKITSINYKQGIPAESVFDIIKGPLGYFWMPFNQGLIKVKKSDLEALVKDKNHKFLWHVYDKSDGMKNEHCRAATSSLINNNGHIFIPTNGGVLNIYPKNLPINLYTPPVYINRVMVDKDIFEHPLNITIKPDQKRLVINFTALSYAAPNKVKFKYKLKGFDQEWIEISNSKRQAIYTNLSGGNYTFNVIAANNDGIWNTVGSILEIHVEPQLIDTWWFRLILFLLLIALVWGIIYIRTRASQLLAKRLETTVNQRTAELQQTYDELSQQKVIADTQNKNIIDSINYAKRIQDAMLPSAEQVKKIIPDSFIFFQPKDIVSGDFYWVGEHQGKKIVAAVDCTGHGVPGAFMSMIGNDLLNKIVYDYNILEPNLILDMLNKEVNNILRQGDSKVRDGMDIALIVYDPKDRFLKFSGGHNPLVYVHNGEIITIKSDKRAIGGFEDEFFFTQHQVQVEENMVFYIYTDGYQDQFGGEKNRKFMKKRLRELILNISIHSMSYQKDIISKRLNEWKGNMKQVDDILVIALILTVEKEDSEPIV